MDIERLREFLTIVNEGSFRRAAEKLQVSPSVLSARFQGFERSMGAVLLKRNNHWVKPTEQGRALIRQGEDLLDCWEHTAGKLDAMKNREATSLAIQLCGQTMPSELGIYLDIYARSHPRLFPNLYDDNSFMVREGLSSGNADISFAPGLAHDFEDITGRIVMAHFHHLHVHVANDHPLAGNGRIRFKNLEDETIILYPSMRDPFVRELQMKLIQRSGIRCEIYPGEYSQFFYDLLVPIDQGVRLFNWNDRLAPNTTMLTVEDPGYDTWLYLLYSEENQNPAVTEFIDGFIRFRKERI
jgi:DNA-binding transcriptional LysR family regulator